MKNVLYLFVFALMLNCSADKTYEPMKSEEAITVVAARATSKVLFGGAIGIVDRVNGKMSFLKDQKSVLRVFNSMLKKSDIAANLTTVKLDQGDDGVYYLRGYGSKYQSTMLLVPDDNGNLQSSGVTCTTEDCSHTTGCSVTVGGTCSACSGDCKKTTSSDSY